MNPLKTTPDLNTVDFTITDVNQDKIKMAVLWDVAL
jgi:hypothetical protein